MLKYCPSSKLIPFIAELFDTMINNQLQPAGLNVSLLKPILKSDSKPNDDFSNTSNSSHFRRDSELVRESHALEAQSKT